MDPKAEKYASLSPFAYVANNPINAVDPNGAEIIFANTESKEQFTRLYEASNDQTKNRLDVLIKSDQVYNINVSRTLKDSQGNALVGGETIYNFNTNQVDINIDPTGHEGDIIPMLGDELTHASQFETGDLAFVENGGQSVAVGYDMQDEFDSKLGSMNAVNDVNAKEGTIINYRELPRGLSMLIIKLNLVKKIKQLRISIKKIKLVKSICEILTRNQWVNNPIILSRFRR